MSNSKTSDANKLLHAMAREVWLTARDWKPKSDSPTGISRYVKVDGNGYAMGIAYVDGVFMAYVSIDGDGGMHVMNEENDVVSASDITQALSCATVHHAYSILDDLIDMICAIDLHI